MNYLYLILFIFTSAVHLYYSYVKDDRGRAATKSLPLIMLLGYYLESAVIPSWTIIAALIASWLGDLLLIGKDTKWFVAGGISFMLSHVFLIWSYIERTPLFNLVSIVFILIFLGFSLLMGYTMIDYLDKKSLKIGMPIYFLFNCSMNAVAWSRSIALPGDLASFLTCLGASLFLISDITLFFVRFDNKDGTKSHFMVMLTYLLGEFVIVQSLL